MKALHLHHLRGCAPAPLARYLKALGILRLIAEQKDPAVRGWWQDEHFCLLTRLSRPELEKFFLEEYKPTAVLNPWGARSGFYPGGSEKGAREVLQKIERSALARLSELQSAVATVRTSIREIGGQKPEKEETKIRFLGPSASDCSSPSTTQLNEVESTAKDDEIIGRTSDRDAAAECCWRSRCAVVAQCQKPIESARLR